MLKAKASTASKAENQKQNTDRPQAHVGLMACLVFGSGHAFRQCYSRQRVKGIKDKGSNFDAATKSKRLSHLEGTHIASEWFYQITGKQAGPISIAELRILAQRSLLSHPG